MQFDGPRTLDRRFLEFGEQYPGFAGFFLDETSLVIQVTAESSLADVAAETVKDDLAAIIGRDRERLSATSIRYQTVEYEFETLDRWRNAVRTINTGGKVLRLDIDERENRIRIGVSDVSAEPSIRADLLRMEIPDAAVIVEETLPVVPAARLSDRLRPVPGSMQIEYQDSQGPHTCTIGFNAWVGGYRGFVSAAHCSPRMGLVDSSTDYHQNTESLLANRVGYEVRDPPTHSCPNPVSAPCRWSDANFVRYFEADTWDFPRMAIAYQGSTTIQELRDVLCHNCDATVQGDTVWRQGRTTGRRGGTVFATCEDVYNAEDDIWLRCQYSAKADFRDGDSGGPVFTFSGEGVWVHGIAWGGNMCAPWCEPEYTFSEMVQIEHELGFLIAEEGM